ncbi:NHL repeat-containing protein [Dokdonia sp. Hel_I_53]|uniref:NHL repeat-containing protein n=1 Tax=Dokdonia sp. Hel_I_53 TaxID=1566287 RepID=UPI001198EEDF|nr:NHL repeat-containing protein [Dokdonia sp. Hel_I_53]TVZ52159.1 hypothetical protein OD90_1324 [Dokdonia sp. Hel_I_53]
MKYIYVLIVAALLTISCKEDTSIKKLQWVHARTINLDGVNPIGISSSGKNGLWLSDGDHHRVVLVNDEGIITKTIDSLDRPMHIDSKEDVVYIPQYGNDEILSVKGDNRVSISITDSLDAPAGVSLYGNEFAIADFYNNRILYTADFETWSSFGKEGKADGDFYYPTDVQITESAIWVADAYNNRIQKFNKKGAHLQTIGEDQGMNATTGIFVTSDEVISTDFENNRVLVFDLQGNLKQTLTRDVSKPTDILVTDDNLYITNYKGKSLSVFNMKEVTLQTSGEVHDHDNHKY